MKRVCNFQEVGVCKGFPFRKDFGYYKVLYARTVQIGDEFMRIVLFGFNSEKQRFLRIAQLPAVGKQSRYFSVRKILIFYAQYRGYFQD